MAINKINLNSFGNLPEIEIKYLQKEGQVITIQTKLPYEEIFNLIQWAVNLTLGDHSFISEPLRIVIQDLAIVKGFTNINLDKMDLVNCTARDVYEIYDILMGHDIIEEVKNLINGKQLKFFEETLQKTLVNITAYRTSAAGILEKLQDDKMAEIMQADALKNLLDNDKDVNKIIEMFQMMGNQISEKTK